VALLPGNGAIEKIPGIKLHAGFRGEDFHYPPAGGFVNPRRQLQAAGLVIDHEVVVVTAAKSQLFVIIIDACANGGWLGEIQRRSLDGAEFASGNERLIHWSKPVGVQHQFMLQDVSRSLTCQIEITMLRQIDGSRFVRSGLIIEDQLILFAKRVGDFHFQVAGIAFFAV